MTISPVNVPLANTTAKSSTEQDFGNAPVRVDEEWANALTHGFASLTAILGMWVLITEASSASDGGFTSGLVLACAAYMISVIGTFVSSTLSHLILKQPLLDSLRAWDQAMIYTMISGTYTPIIFRFAPEQTRTWLLTAIWMAAGIGFFGKIFLKHRVNSIGTVSYLLLGWLPAIPMAGHVPSPLVWSMLIGGMLYSLGVILLMNDNKRPYLHAGWHLFVMMAATTHFLGILWFVLR